ncbi:hypothetical protein LguiA_025664 [Lonicera macranthoides]
MRVKFSDTNYGKVMFQYEKLHAFYYSCGMVGHGGCLKASPDKRRYKGADAEEGVRTNDKRRVMSVNTTVADYVNSPVDVQDSLGDDLGSKAAQIEGKVTRNDGNPMKRWKRGEKREIVVMAEKGGTIGVKRKGARDGIMSSKIINFRDVVDECAFVDLGCQGYRFTWENNHHNEETYGDARQDWVFVTKDWSDLFPFARVLNVIQHGSDHMPIKLCLQGIVGNQRVRRYRSRKFEEWCEVVVSNAWVGVASNDQCSGNFSQRLRVCNDKL